MSQIMGLPADCLTKPVTKDLTLFAKGHWKGYQAAIADMQNAIEEVFDDKLFDHDIVWDVADVLECRLALREKAQALLDDKS